MKGQGPGAGDQGITRSSGLRTLAINCHAFGIKKSRKA